jgi:hypothetical protein
MQRIRHELPVRTASGGSRGRIEGMGFRFSSVGLIRARRRSALAADEPDA